MGCDEEFAALSGGQNERKSKAHARHVVEELTRVVKDGGYIIILEQYNRHRFFSSVIFYLTLWGAPHYFSQYLASVSNPLDWARM